MDLPVCQQPYSLELVCMDIPDHDWNNAIWSSIAADCSLRELDQLPVKLTSGPCTDAYISHSQRSKVTLTARSLC